MALFLFLLKGIEMNRKQFNSLNIGDILIARYDAENNRYIVERMR